MRLGYLLMLFVGFGLSATYQHYTTRQNHSELLDKIEVLSTQNEKIRRHNATLDRHSKQLWKVKGVVNWKVNDEVASIFGVDNLLLASMREYENGREGYEYGVERIDSSIRKYFPPEMWQAAASARIINQENRKRTLGYVDDKGRFVKSRDVKNSIEILARRYNYKYRTKWATNVRGLYYKNLRKKYGRKKIIYAKVTAKKKKLKSKKKS